MRSVIAALVANLLLFGCASTPARPPLPNITAAPAPDVHAIRVETPAPSRRMPTFGAACPLFFPPHEVGSVVRIPGRMMSLAMDPVMTALCACTNSGEYGVIVADIDFGRGSVFLRAPESSAIQSCVETLHITFDAPPESDLPTSDCINCGPRYYGVFVDSPPRPKEAGMRVNYSFLLDRSGEVLDCPGGTHAARGVCQSDVEPEKTAPAKRTCGCAPEDLACAMACASTK